MPQNYNSGLACSPRGGASMKKRYSLGTPLLVLLLPTWLHAMHRMSGYVTQIGDTKVEIRARFYPRAPFTITPFTTFHCGHERVSAALLRVRDLVAVSFRVKVGQWMASDLKIEATKKTCGAGVEPDDRRPPPGGHK